jgi:hypothetical protein
MAAMLSTHALALVGQGARVATGAAEAQDLGVEVAHLLKAAVQRVDLAGDVGVRGHAFGLDAVGQTVDGADERTRGLEHVAQAHLGVGAARRARQGRLERCDPARDGGRVVRGAGERTDPVERGRPRAAFAQRRVRQAAVADHVGVHVAEDAFDADARALPAQGAGAEHDLPATVAFRHRVRDVVRHEFGRAGGRGEAGEGVREGGRDAHRLSLAQRLMLVVSCSISSTVWMTLAFDE